MLRQPFELLNYFSSMKVSEIIVGKKSQGESEWSTSVNNVVSNGKEPHTLLIKYENTKNLILQNQFQLGVECVMLQILTNQIPVENWNAWPVEIWLIRKEE